MSTSGVFRLLANEGKVDRMIMASDLLKQRIADIRRAKQKANDPDPTPSIPDLEKSHIIFVNAHYKPFAAIGFEYNKVLPSSGVATNLTESPQSMTFSVPQFGDFFHDMVLRTRLGQVRTNVNSFNKQRCEGLLPNPGEDGLDNENPVDGDIPVGIYDAFGNCLARILTIDSSEVESVDWTTANALNYNEFVSYCEYPATRFYANVKFNVNGNPLDEYSYQTANMLDKFIVSPNKRVAHDILTGQETPMKGYSGPKLGRVVDNDSNHTNSNSDRNDGTQSNRTLSTFQSGGIGSTSPPPLKKNGKAADVPWGQNPLRPVAGGEQFAYNVANNAFNPARDNYDISREVKNFVNGPQTPKPIQPALELWSRLRFWFNEDVRLSVPSVSIPFGQRFVDVTTAAASDILATSPSIYLGYYPKNVGWGVTDGGDARQQLGLAYVPIPVSSNNNFVAPALANMEMYINNIFVNNEVHDIYIERIGFSLIRVYRSQSATFSNTAISSQLTSLKWPVEYMYVGLQPSFNVNKQNPNYLRDWHRYTRQVDVSVDPNAGDSTRLVNDVVAGSGLKSSKKSVVINKSDLIDEPVKNFVDVNVNNMNACRFLQAPVVNDKYWLTMTTIDRISVTSHGIKIYDNFSDMFFAVYMPFHYGGSMVMSSEDEGALFVNLALIPRSYQPSGHLNLSRARETYIDIQSKYCGNATPCELYVQALCINFLLYAEGSASLRYST